MHSVHKLMYIDVILDVVGGVFPKQIDNWQKTTMLEVVTDRPSTLYFLLASFPGANSSRARSVTEVLRIAHISIKMIKQWWWWWWWWWWCTSTSVSMQNKGQARKTSESTLPQSLLAFRFSHEPSGIIYLDLLLHHSFFIQQLSSLSVQISGPTNNVTYVTILEPMDAKVWWWLRNSRFTLFQPSGNLFQWHSHRCCCGPTQHLPQKDPAASAHESWQRWEEGRGGRENSETNEALMLMLRIPILPILLLMRILVSQPKQIDYKWPQVIKRIVAQRAMTSTSCKSWRMPHEMVSSFESLHSINFTLHTMSFGMSLVLVGQDIKHLNAEHKGKRCTLNTGIWLAPGGPEIPCILFNVQDTSFRLIATLFTLSTATNALLLATWRSFSLLAQWRQMRLHAATSKHQQHEFIWEHPSTNF